MSKGPTMSNDLGSMPKIDEAVPFIISHKALVPELLDANIDKLLQQVKDLILVVADLQKRVERLEASESSPGRNP
jgi:hypothetical protein